LTTCARAQARAGSHYPFLTQKERDIETGLDYFGARYYSSTQGRFTGADNPGFSNGSDPQTWNLYAYTANNPLRRVDPDGRDWFQIGDGHGARFEWHEGKKYKYKDEDGNEQTAKNVGTHLLVFEFSRNEDGSIRRNSDGAAIGTLTLYNQNRVVAENNEAFTGGTGYDDMPVGVFTIRTDIRERASNESALKPDNPRELKQIYGLQEIDRSLGFAGPWGSKRAALNEWDPNLPKLYRGNFLHGRERTTSVTAGCICDRRETVLDAIFAINHRVTPRVKAVVTDGAPRIGDARPGPYVIRP
jgi:RHS repeat-associated protein